MFRFICAWVTRHGEFSKYGGSIGPGAALECLGITLLWLVFIVLWVVTP